MENQKQMEAEIATIVAHNNNEQAQIINGMIKPEFVECSYENTSLTMAYPMMDWQANRVGVIHGGIITTCIDNAMAILVINCGNDGFTPTISMENKFIRSIMPGDKLVIKVEIVHLGRTIIHVKATAKSQESGKIVATSVAVFMNGQG